MSTDQVSGSDPVEEKRKLIILGLAWQSTEQSLNAHMAKFGPVEECYIMRDRSTGSSRGFAFVTFATPEGAAAAIAAKEGNAEALTLDGRPLDPQYATQRKPASWSGRGGAQGAPVRPTNRIFVGKLSETSTQESVSAYFSAFGEVTDCYLPPGPAGHKGFGFVSFADAAVASQMLERADHVLDGAEIAVSPADPKRDGMGPAGPRGPRVERSSGWGYDPSSAGFGYGPPQHAAPYPGRPGPHAYGSHQGHHGPPHGGRGPAHTYGGRHYGAAAGAHGPSDGGRGVDDGRRIFVGRIGYTTHRDVVRRLFEQYGEVDDVYLASDAGSERNKGFGFVTFVDPAVARTVLAQRSFELEGRQIVVGPASRKGTGPMGSSAPPPPGPPGPHYPAYGMPPYGASMGPGYGNMNPYHGAPMYGSPSPFAFHGGMPPSASHPIFPSGPMTDPAAMAAFQSSLAPGPGGPGRSVPGQPGNPFSGYQHSTSAGGYGQAPPSFPSFQVNQNP